MNEFSVTPLGTVSPYPKDKCNCPGFLIQSGEEKILLDCGSGVSRLLKFPDDLKNLIIIISHFHPDHYSDMGCVSSATLCYHRLGELNEKIKVYIPRITSITNPVCTLPGADYLELIDYSEKGYISTRYGCFQHVNLEYGNMKVSFLKNVHDILTFSVKIEAYEKSLVYTSDTAYNDRLVEFCKNVDLLISEATFLKGQNCTFGHMYAWEAGMLAKNANVKKLMLTHFWPEIDKQEYVKEAKEYFKNTIAAREGNKLVLRSSDF